MKTAYQWLSARELVTLRRLVYEAFSLRESPYLVDAAASIVDWVERTRPDREGRLVDAMEAVLDEAEAKLR